MPAGAGCDNLPGRRWQPRNQSPPPLLPHTRFDPLEDPRIRSLQAGLERERPRLIGRDETVSRASVALVARPREEDVELLFIERPHSELDPWSGQGIDQASISEIEDLVVNPGQPRPVPLSAFDIRTVPKRLKTMQEDPLLPVLRLRPDLMSALAKLADLL